MSPECSISNPNSYKQLKHRSSDYQRSQNPSQRGQNPKRGQNPRGGQNLQESSQRCLHKQVIKSWFQSSATKSAKAPHKVHCPTQSEPRKVRYAHNAIVKQGETSPQTERTRLKKPTEPMRHSRSLTLPQRHSRSLTLPQRHSRSLTLPQRHSRLLTLPQRHSRQPSLARNKHTLHRHISSKNFDEILVR
jgi:hypothetical protein